MRIAAPDTTVIQMPASHGPVGPVQDRLGMQAELKEP